MAARSLDHDEVLPGHLLIVLATGHGMAPVILRELSVPADGVRRAAEEGLGLGEGAAVRGVAYSAEARGVIALALRENPRPGPNRIGTDHLLIALLRAGGFAAELLAGHGVTADRAVAARDRLLPDMCYGCAENGYTPEPAPRPKLVLPDLQDMNERIALLRRLKEEAVDALDFERAASVRDAEKDLLRRKAMLIKEQTDGFDAESALDEIDRLETLVRHLRGLLHHGHGIASP